MVARTISDSLRVGDLVVDRGFVGVPRVPDDGIGRISKLSGDIAEVEWRDGSNGQVHISAIAHIHEPYEAALHDSAFEIPRFAPGTPVLLGNGDRGHILEQVVGPTGFKTYRVQVDASAAPLTIGRRVYATQNAMVKVGSIKPDVVVSFYKEADLQPSATIGAELAVERDEQIIGLQKYAQLPSDLGMLFPYEPPQEVTFHMGRVRFPIDVIFIDRSGRVAAIEEDCQPGYDSYWRHGVVASVLEVNGGWCRQNKVVLRDAVRLVQAQEHFDPASHRTDAVPRVPTQGPPMDPSRFQDRSLPDEVLKDQPLDPANWEQDLGYDQGNDSMRSFEGPGFRPAASKEHK